MTRHFRLPAIAPHPTLDDPRKPIKTSHYVGTPQISFSNVRRVHPFFTRERHNNHLISNPHDKPQKKFNTMKYGNGVDGVHFQ